MGVLRMAPFRMPFRSVYTPDAIQAMYEANPYAKSFRLTIKLGRGKITQQSVSITFKHFTDKSCLQTIQKFAKLMWKTEECLHRKNKM